MTLITVAIEMVVIEIGIVVRHVAVIGPHGVATVFDLHKVSSL